MQNQGQQLQQLTSLLNQITQNPTAFSTSQLSNATSQAQANYLNMSPNTYQQNVSNQNINATGIPGLMNQYGNLGQQFQMWLADKGFYNQFSNQSPTANLNPYANQTLQQSSAQNQQALNAQNQTDMNRVSNMTTGVQPSAKIASPIAQGSPAPNTGSTQNPFLSSTQDIVNSVSNLPTAPSVATAQGGQVLNAGTNMLSLINSLIGSEQGVAQNATTQDVAAYQDKMNTMGNIAQLLGNSLSTQQAYQQNAALNAANMPGTTQNAASAYQTLKDNFVSQQQALGQDATPDGFWYFLNSQKNALAAQGVDVNELYKLQGQDRQTLGGNGNLMSGAKGVTKPVGSYQQKTLYKGTPYETIVNFDSKTGKMTDPNTGKPVKYTDATTRSTESALQNIDSMWNQWNKLSPLEKHLPDELVTLAPSLSPTRAALNTQFYTGLEGDLRKAIVGGRITQQEINWIKNAIIPTATDSDASAKAKVDAVENALKMKLQDPSIDLTQTKLPGSSVGKTMQIGKYQVSY